MKTNEIQKDLDAVKVMREISDKISMDIKDMSFEELRNYIDTELSNQKRPVGQTWKSPDATNELKTMLRKVTHKTIKVSTPSDPSFLSHP